MGKIKFEDQLNSGTCSNVVYNTIKRIEKYINGN